MLNASGKITSETRNSETKHDASPIRNMTCCCCLDATRGRQWRNRDTGFGLCPACAKYISQSVDAEQMRKHYGDRGIHYDIQEEGNVR